MNIHKILIRIFRLLFGEFNGVQVFLYPMTLFYWINTDSFLMATTGLLTSQKYFFPLVVFLLVSIYIAFLVIKNYSALHSGRRPHPESEKTSFNLTVIGLHKLLLITLFIIGLIYIVSAFLKHFYGISLPLRGIYFALIRFVSVALILGYALRNSWTRPYREQGLDIRRALALVRNDYRHHYGRYLLHGSAYILMTILASAIYNLIILNGFYLIGISPNLYLAGTTSFPTLFYDLFVICVALIISNLIFSPLVMLVAHLADKFHPHQYLIAPEAPSGETD